MYICNGLVLNLPPENKPWNVGRQFSAPRKKRTMKKAILLFILFLISEISFSQTCKCETELKFVSNYYEKNLPSFIDNVNSSNRKQYEKFKKLLFYKSKNSNSKMDCFKLLTYYVEYFKDNHSSIYMQDIEVNENDEKSLENFLNSETYKSREHYNLKETDLKQFAQNDIRGIYQNSDSTITITVIPNKDNFREYIGVVTESKSKLWKKGQVKIEINKNGKGGFEAFYYSYKHSLKFYPDYTLQNGILGDFWFKKSLKNKVNYSHNFDNKIEYKTLNDSTSYLRISSFSSELNAKIDSLYKKIDSEILKKPYLIIDVRNNGGGSDGNVYPLLKYIYTKPFIDDKVELYVTKDNIQVWENWYNEQSKDTINYNKQNQLESLAEINKMKNAENGTFIPRGSSENKTIKLEKVEKYPKNVAIITNRWCASSCESLLFLAKESDKSIIVGENSGGYVGYGEVGEIITPCYKFDLTCTMTRYDKQREFEVIGISPNYKLNNDKSWIEQTMEILEKK